MGAQQPKQFRKSKLRGISAVRELISGLDSKAFQMVGDQVANLGPTTIHRCTGDFMRLCCMQPNPSRIAVWTG
jgi:hypothetical protein